MARHNVLKIGNDHVVPLLLCLYWTVQPQVKSCTEIYQRTEVTLGPKQLN